MTSSIDDLDAKMIKELELKANKASVATALHRKANKTELNELELKITSLFQKFGEDQNSKYELFN